MTQWLLGGEPFVSFSRDSSFEFVLMIVPPTMAMIKPKFAVPARCAVQAEFG
jgi:hypothetical protein